MLELLEQLFRHVRGYMNSERLNRHQVFFHSSKHTTMQFDREAEDIIISGLIDSGHGFEIITEERSPFATSATPEYRIVVDPVDGSTNVSHGIMTAGVALAVLPIDAPVCPEYVEWALVGELFSGTVYQAWRGGGAFCNGRRCQVSETKGLTECLAGIDFDSRDLAVLQKLLITNSVPAHVRRSGSSAIDVVYVANGAYDAYIDVGGMLTGESFLASASIVLEAGGKVSDEQGKPLRPIANLTENFSIVVASTKELHAEILARIQS